MLRKTCPFILKMQKLFRVMAEKRDLRGFVAFRLQKRGFTYTASTIRDIDREYAATKEGALIVGIREDGGEEIIAQK